MFYLREIKDFSLLKYVFTGSVIFSSLIVIISYIFFDVYRGFAFNSCISGAQHLLVLSSFSFLFAINGKEEKQKFIFAFSSIISVFASLCSETRGVVLCVPVLFITVLILSPNKLKLKKIALISIGFCVTTSILYISNKNINKRVNDSISNAIEAYRYKGLNNDEFSSIGNRYELLKFAYKTWTTSPILGYGRQGFVNEIVKNGYNSKYISHATHIHNEYFSALVMRGFWGGFFLIFFISSLFLLFYKLSKRNGDLYPKCGMTFLIAYCLYFLTDSPLIGSMHSVAFFITTILVLFYASFNSSNDKNAFKYIYYCS